MSYLLIMNPGSRSGTSTKRWKAWKAGLKHAGVDYACAVTEGKGHAIELARSTDVETVVAVGGDGTINEVLDGAVQSGKPNLKMGVLYSGTSPDFCRFHGIPIGIEHALTALLAGRAKRVDVVRITCFDADGREMTAHFGCSCNIGMGAAVAGFANGWRRYLGDTVGTGMGVIRAIAQNDADDLAVEIDGVTHNLAAVNNLTIAKNPHIASGLRLRLDLQPDDGRLAVVGVYGRSRIGLLKLLPEFYSGSASSAEGMFVQYGKSVTVSSRSRQEIEFDGDPQGYLPVKTEILPGALTLIGGDND